MKRLLFPSLLGAVALLAPGRSWAQDKPVLNTAPIVIPAPAPVVVPVAPTPVTTPTTPTATPTPATQPGTAPSTNLPVPDTYSPSGLELPEREQKRKALQQHAEQYTKMFVYSGIGLGYSSYYGLSNFNFSISPAIGYRVSDRFSIGPGISYAYNYYGADNGNGTNTSFNTSSFGVKGFAQLMVIDRFFVHAEYEVTKAEFLAVDNNGYITGGKVSRSIQTPLLGVGYRSQISNRAAADIVVLYNFQDNYNSIYPNPVIRFNFLFNIGR
ncbi:MAG: hypothetical protein ACRYG7_55230 [Janthinobacterium lividum]